MDTIALDPRLSGATREFPGRVGKNLIDGKLVAAASGKTFPVYNPATGTVVCSVAEADSEDVDRAVKAARRAFDDGGWPRTKPNERSRLLWKLADLLEKHTDEFAELESLDNGKPVAVTTAL
jgi:phenylacetaldehyde dehydrogenase